MVPLKSLRTHHACTHTLSLTKLLYPLSQSLVVTQLFSLFLSLSLSLSLSHSHTHSLSLSLSLSLSYPQVIFYLPLLA